MENASGIRGAKPNPTTRGKGVYGIITVRTTYSQRAKIMQAARDRHGLSGNEFCLRAINRAITHDVDHRQRAALLRLAAEIAGGLDMPVELSSDWDSTSATPEQIRESVQSAGATTRRLCHGWAQQIRAILDF
jgi:uncharacterized protein (DUF1778 family)